MITQHGSRDTIDAIREAIATAQDHGDIAVLIFEPTALDDAAGMVDALKPYVDIKHLVVSLPETDVKFEDVKLMMELSGAFGLMVVVSHPAVYAERRLIFQGVRPSYR